MPTPFSPASSVNAAIATILFQSLGDLPAGLTFSLAGPVNEVVGWMAVHLHFITSWVRDILFRELGYSPFTPCSSGSPGPR